MSSESRFQIGHRYNLHLQDSLLRLLDDRIVFSGSLEAFSGFYIGITGNNAYTFITPPTKRNRFRIPRYLADVRAVQSNLRNGELQDFLKRHGEGNVTLVRPIVGIRDAPSRNYYLERIAAWQEMQ